MEKRKKHVHMLGICGTGMGSLAGLLLEKGYVVTGTDESVYPPISTQLENLGIKICVGYGPANLDPRPDLVIIGNVITKENPEAKAVLEKEIPYLSMPQALSQLFLTDKESIVVTGTHGKTTTSNIIAWLLDSAKNRPSFLIGGVGLNFGTSYRYGAGRYFVIEGDEYDTAFFDKGPKFLHYRPKYAIISSIEFDHADIYKDLDQIKDAFTKFIQKIPTDGICVACADNGDILDILHHAKCKTITYGFSDRAEYRIDTTCHCESPKEAKQSSEQAAAGDCFGAKAPRNDRTTFTITHSQTKHKFETPLAGRHNLYNASAALILLLELGFDPAVLGNGLKHFGGVKRRQEIKGVVNSITVIDDFAHHPTAIKETIGAIKTRFPDGRIWAIFEPRSNTTRRRVFEKELTEAFRQADKAIIARVHRADLLPEEERLDPEKVVSMANRLGSDAHYIPETGDIVEFVIKGVEPKDVILVMSNGAFDNICEKLLVEINHLSSSRKWGSS